jgi:hypothetical protein
MLDTEFWEKWIKADELNRLKLVKTLTPFTRGGLCRHMTATLMNSYLVDLYNTVKKK